MVAPARAPFSSPALVSGTTIGCACAHRGWVLFYTVSNSISNSGNIRRTSAILQHYLTANTQQLRHA